MYDTDGDKRTKLQFMIYKYGAITPSLVRHMMVYVHNVGPYQRRCNSIRSGSGICYIGRQMVTSWKRGNAC